MADIIEKLLGSTIQHGPLNRRIYVIKLNAAGLPRIIPALEELARKNGYEKILAKIPKSSAEAFQQAGFVQEAAIPDFFRHGEKVLFLSRFLNPDRGREKHPRQVVENRLLIDRTPGRQNGKSPIDVSGIQICTADDAGEMSELYKQVFPTYPFPILNSDYLLETMASHCRYFCIRHQNRIAALAACEMDPDNRNVEMTDFAVLPQWRGRGLASKLLVRMETDMRREEMRVAYTISRTLSLSINIIFKKQGYVRGGKLTNNTNIAGRIESMWVWHKRLIP